MKFLCIPCDEPMKLLEVGPPDRGSLAVRFACPACGYEVAMLTNPYETQMVTSLGVRIGTEGEKPDPGLHTSGSSPAEPTAGSRCPFAAMVGPDSGSRANADLKPRGDAGLSEPPALSWTSQAEARLAKVPVFVRPMARAGIERFARERGCECVDETLMDQAREFFGM